MLRLPDGMRDRIAEAAKTNNRTMNAEIVARLQQSFDAERTSSQAEREAADRRNIERGEALMGELLALAERLRADYASRPAVEAPPSEPLPQTQKEFRKAQIDRTVKREGKK